MFQNAESHAIQLVPPGYHDNGIFVNQTEPLKAQGGFLQVVQGIHCRMVNFFVFLKKKNFLALLLLYLTKCTM